LAAALASSRERPDHPDLPPVADEVTTARVSLFGLTRNSAELPAANPFTVAQSDAPFAADRPLLNTPEFWTLVSNVKQNHHLTLFHFIHLRGPNEPDPVHQHFTAENAVHVWTQKVTDPYYHYSMQFRKNLQQQIAEELFNKVSQVTVPFDLGAPLYPQHIHTLTPIIPDGPIRAGRTQILHYFNHHNEIHTSDRKPMVMMTRAGMAVSIFHHVITLQLHAIPILPVHTHVFLQQIHDIIKNPTPINATKVVAAFEAYQTQVHKIGAPYLVTRHSKPTLIFHNEPANRVIRPLPPSMPHRVLNWLLDQPDDPRFELMGKAYNAIGAMPLIIPQPPPFPVEQLTTRVSSLGTTLNFGFYPPHNPAINDENIDMVRAVERSLQPTPLPEPSAPVQAHQPQPPTPQVVDMDIQQEEPALDLSLPKSSSSSSLDSSSSRSVTFHNDITSVTYEVSDPPSALFDQLDSQLEQCLSNDRPETPTPPPTLRFKHVGDGAYQLQPRPQSRWSGPSASSPQPSTSTSTF